MSNLRTQAEALANRGYSEIGFLDSTTENESVYVAITPELAGCLGQGETLQEAIDNLRLFRVDYMEHFLENNLPIPGPLKLGIRKKSEFQDSLPLSEQKQLLTVDQLTA